MVAPHEASRAVSVGNCSATRRGQHRDIPHTSPACHVFGPCYSLRAGSVCPGHRGRFKDTPPVQRLACMSDTVLVTSPHTRGSWARGWRKGCRAADAPRLPRGLTPSQALREPSCVARSGLIFEPPSLQELGLLGTPTAAPLLGHKGRPVAGPPRVPAFPAGPVRPVSPASCRSRPATCPTSTLRPPSHGSRGPLPKLGGVRATREAKTPTRKQEK